MPWSQIITHLEVQGSLTDRQVAFRKDRTQRVVLDGTKSYPAGVTSGVPQGSVLGPLLFLVRINYLPACIPSEARLFAEDCLVYRAVSTQEDAAALQDDLGRLQEWEEKWLTKFIPEKCEVLRVTNKTRHIITAQYTTHGTTLQTVDEAKYRGVTIHGKLNWKPHVNNILARKPISPKASSRET